MMQKERGVTRTSAEDPESWPLNPEKQELITSSLGCPVVSGLLFLDSTHGRLEKANDHHRILTPGIQGAP
ncbi:unnamed protein product [Caretta caretta]